MNAELINVGYYVMLGSWIVAPALLFAFHSRHGQLPGVLVYAYIFGFFMSHWPGALVHASPWSEFFDSFDTVSGFRLSTYALLSLLAGAALLRAPPGAGWPIAAADHPATGRAVTRGAALEYQSVRLLLAIGIASWILSFTPVIYLPSAAAVISAGKQCSLLVVCLLCWRAWREGNLSQFRLWILAALALPVVTVSTSGFIGYGVAMLGTVLLFVAMFYRPRWIIVAWLVAGVYGGLSLWVAYAEVRTEIRNAVWGEEDTNARFTAMSKVFDVIEPFDLSNQNHLDMVDLRLNQNVLVGAAVRVTPELVPYASGATILDAIAALIPRALWPGKPDTGGSGNYVSRYTMTEFAAGTSVGMGQVLEFYINFGVPSVVIGFLLLGMLLRRLDIGLTHGIEKGDYASVQFYFLVGTGALQAGGSLAEMAASMAGGAVLAIALSKYMRRSAAQTPATAPQAVPAAPHHGDPS